MKNLAAFSGIFVLFLFSHVQLLKASIAALPAFQKNDRVLVLAPHPDDETVGASAAIQQALKVGAECKVVYFTYGERNKWAFRYFEKKLFYGAESYRHMKAVRQEESLQALAVQGVRAEAVSSLGYPDSGMLEIFTRHWNAGKPYSNRAFRLTHIPYHDALSPGAAHAGENVLRDLKAVLLDYRPTKIFVSHPADANGDHQALYLFLSVALWDLEDELVRPEVFAYMIHSPQWPYPKAYDASATLSIPPQFSDDSYVWKQLQLSSEEIKRKHEAVLQHASQFKYAPEFLVSFVRKNEIYGVVGPQALQPIFSSKSSSEEKIFYANREEFSAQNRAAVYYRVGDDLMIHLTVKTWLNLKVGSMLSLIGYRKGTAFSEMPKIRLTHNFKGVHVSDQRETLNPKLVGLTLKGKTLIYRVPLSLLGSPDYVLSCARLVQRNFSAEERAWRILELEIDDRKEG